MTPSSQWPTPMFIFGQHSSSSNISSSSSSTNCCLGPVSEHSTVPVPKLWVEDASCTCTCGSAPFVQQPVQPCSSCSAPAEFLGRRLVCVAPLLTSPCHSPSQSFLGSHSSSSGYISSAFSPTSGSMRLPDWGSSRSSLAYSSSWVSEHSRDNAPFGAWGFGAVGVDLGISCGLSSSISGCSTFFFGSRDATAAAELPPDQQASAEAALPNASAAAAASAVVAISGPFAGSGSSSGSFMLPAGTSLVGAVGASTCTTHLAERTAAVSPAPAAAAAAAAAADKGCVVVSPATPDTTPWLLQLPFGLLQRIAQHLVEELPNHSRSSGNSGSSSSSRCKDIPSSSTSSSRGGSASKTNPTSSSTSNTDGCSSGSSGRSDAAAALQELSCTCMLLRQAVLATLPHLNLQLHQLQDLAACQHTLSSVTVLTIKVKPRSNSSQTGQPFSQLSKAASDKEPQQPQQQQQDPQLSSTVTDSTNTSEPSTSATAAAAAAAAANKRQLFKEVQESLPQALTRLPYVRHVVLRGGGLLPLVQPLQLLPHLQEVSLQGRQGRMGLLPAVLAHARDAAARSAQQLATQQAAVKGAAQQAAAQQAAQAAAAKQQVAVQQQQQQQVQVSSAAVAAPVRSSYRDALLARQAIASSSKGATATGHSKGVNSRGSTSSSSGAGSNGGSSSSSSGKGSSSLLNKVGWDKVKATANSVTYSLGLGTAHPNASTSVNTNNCSSSSSSRCKDTDGCQAVQQPALPMLLPRPVLPALHDLSCLRRLTLRRLNLGTIRYSSSSSSSSSSFCPLSLLGQHLTRLQCLSLQQVVLDRAGLASLAGVAGHGTPRRPVTALPSTLQVDGGMGG